MTDLQARLIAARSVRAVQDQERFARRLRSGDGIPAQRRADQDAPVALMLVAGASA